MNTKTFLTLISLSIAVFTACDSDHNCITGSGEYVSREYPITDFETLSINGLVDAYITEGETTSLRIEAEENVLNSLEVKVENNRLIIGDDKCYKDIKTIKVYVSTPTLYGLYCAGDCNVSSPDVFAADVFNANISGTGHMNFVVNAQEINCSISGDAGMRITGSALDQNYDVSGFGEFACFELEGENADITISGEAELEVNVSDNLKVDISGKGTVYYKGNPAIKQNISGIGSIIKVN